MHYDNNKAKCPECKNLIKKYHNVNCPKCNSSFKARWGDVRKGKQKCPSCGRSISKNDLPDFGGGAAPARAAPAQAPPQVITRTIIQQPQTSFKQTGILCLACMNVTPLGNKKCQTCKKKLKVKPSVMVYFNGVKDQVQCQKCKGYTDWNVLKCQNCGKKLKL